MFTPEGLADRLQKWLDNGGREELQLAQRKAEIAGRRIIEESRPDPEIMRQPMTI